MKTRTLTIARPLVRDGSAIDAVDGAAAARSGNMPLLPAPGGLPGATNGIGCAAVDLHAPLKRAGCCSRLRCCRRHCCHSWPPTAAATAGEQPRTAGLMPPSDSEDESSDEAGAEQEQQPKVVMIQVRRRRGEQEGGAG